jgi:ribonucleoside-triphosphate reductase
MGLLVRQSFDERFVKKLQEIESKYGHEIFDIDGIGAEHLDINTFARKFFTKKVVADVSSDANANVDDDSVLSFEYEFTKSIQKLNGYYIIWKKIVESFGVKRANKLLELSINGALKIHDLHMSLKPYCYAFSLEPLIIYGMPFIKKVKIRPCRHFSSYINHIIQFTAYTSNQLAGACAYPDLFIFMDWFARKDFGENYLEYQNYRKEVEQNLQSMIYSWNFPFRGSQCAFVNTNLYDKYFMEDLFTNTVYPDGSKPNFESITKLQEFYMRWFIEESKDQTFTFPINTVTFYKNEKGEIPDKKFLSLVSELNAYNGAFNIFTGELGVLSSCCRLRNDAKQIEYTNSFGAGGVSIGSSRVVTINLPRIAYQAEDDNDYFKILEYNAKAAQDILMAQRKILQENIDKNKLPLYTHNFMFLQKQFMTVGYIGANEACELQGYDIIDEQGTEFVTKIFNKINYLNEQRTKEDGNIRNLEQIPGESAAYNLAEKDKLLFSGHEYKLYANQYIPLWKNVDIEDRIRMQGQFDSLNSGGAICHLNSTESLDKDQMQTLIEFAASKGVTYFAVNVAQCRCNTCGKLFIGNFKKSPCHDAATTHYLRVVGFLTPVENWSPPRREEYEVRQFYSKNEF